MICKDGNKLKNGWLSSYKHKEWGKEAVIKSFFTAKNAKLSQRTQS